MQTAEQLLERRELKALRTQTTVRGAGLLVFAVFALPIAATTFEWVATAAALTIHASFVGASVFWLRRHVKLNWVGFGGAS